MRWNNSSPEKNLTAEPGIEHGTSQSADTEPSGQTRLFVKLLYTFMVIHRRPIKLNVKSFPVAISFSLNRRPWAALFLKGVCRTCSLSSC